MKRAAETGRRAGALLFTLLIQVLVALLLLFSLTVVRRIAAPQETMVYVIPPQPVTARPPLVIDARPRPPVQPPPAVATTNLPAVTGGAGITAAPPAAPAPPSDAALTERLGRALDCRPDAAGRTSPLCAAAPGPGNSGTLTLNPSNGVQNEARWAEEKRRNESTDLGVAVGPGVGFVIKDPLCKLAWLAFGGGFSCEPQPPHRPIYTDEQFKAALAAQQQRRGGGRAGAVTSGPSGENGNEKDRTGSSAGTGPDGPGPIPGR